MKKDKAMKRFSVILIFVFSLAIVAYLFLGQGLVQAEKTVNKTVVPQQYRHAGKIDCASCHGKGIPESDSTVENQKCLECHGPMEKLAKKSEPKDFPDRNPHKSHLGDIACTVCHHEHSPSAVYCLECHRNFKMKIPGGKEGDNHQK
jgi:hypothetical protein